MLEPECWLRLRSTSPHSLLTFGNIDFVGRQDVRLNAVYFHVQVLSVALRAGVSGSGLGNQGSAPLELVLGIGELL